MKFLIIFLLFSLSGDALGGGVSQCGVLQSDFIVLLQSCETFTNETLIIINNTVASFPYFGNTYIENFVCNLNLTTDTMASGASQLSGVSADYILEIFNGTISPPFISPLDCIESLLLSYRYYLQYLYNVVIPQMETLDQPSPINETTNCSTVIQLYSGYFTTSLEVTKARNNLGIIAAAGFESIGLLHLVFIQSDLSKTCASNLLINRNAAFLNMNQSIISAFAANTSISVPPPLSCIQDLIVFQIDNLDSSYIDLNNNLNNSRPSSICEPFFNNFKSFETIWLNYINRLREYTTNISIAYPVLTPFFIADLICEVDVMVMFAANATNSLLGVDSELVYNILKESTAPPFASPLDCIANELIYMRTQVSNMINNIIPALENLAVNSTSDTSTCNSTYQALTGYVGTLVTLLNAKGFVVAEGITAFAPVNLSDLYMEAFASILDCLPNLVGRYVGAALNANGTAVVSYVNGNRFTLPYPFNCVKIIIDIINSLLNQALVNFVTDSPNNLVAPKIPKFRG